MSLIQEKNVVDRIHKHQIRIKSVQLEAGQVKLDDGEECCMNGMMKRYVHQIYARYQMSCLVSAGSRIFPVIQSSQWIASLHLR